MTEPAFHLAWCKHYVNQFAASPVRKNLFYALVPVGLGGFVGAMRLETVNDCGKPASVIHATQYELLCLRTPDLRQETQDPGELMLIDALRGRALAASFVLPSILPTTVMPGWSKMPLPAAQVRALKLAGGWNERSGS